MVKQEMTRVNINILGIGELKWAGMGKFNSDDHYIYYCGQESLRRIGVALIIKRRVWNAVHGCNLKNSRRISVHFQNKPFSITVIQVYAPTSNSKEAEIEWFCRPTRPSRSNTKKKKKTVLFIIEDCEAKVRSQEIPEVTGKFGLGVQMKQGKD